MADNLGLIEHRLSISPQECRQARLSRDARFDGQFFTGVLSTGIYCRPICPAVAPKEKNVRYFATAIEAARAGLRPCLRCRPDSAPSSYAWKGAQTSLERALKLIDSGHDIEASSGKGYVESLAERLGISSRYLRKLFDEKLGISPKQYAIYRRLMFAKQLLHQTTLPMTQVALASGFNSIRSFNDSFKQHLQLNPSQIRNGLKSQANGEHDDKAQKQLVLTLAYRPHYNWSASQGFYRLRAVEGMEWLEGNGYGRSFVWGAYRGYFELEHHADNHCFKLSLQLAQEQDLACVRPIVMKIRSMLDLDLDMQVIENKLSQCPWLTDYLTPGLRIPKTWSAFEAGVRAVLGQQVSVKQATKLLNKLVFAYGEKQTINDRELVFFPTPEVLAKASLDELKMPGSRKQALIGLAEYVSEHPNASVEDWLNVKGIGPWTIAYARMRGVGEANVFLASDLIIKQRLTALEHLMRRDTGKELSRKPSEIEQSKTQMLESVLAQKMKLPDAEYRTLAEQTQAKVAPWGSYLTFQLWHL